MEYMLITLFGIFVGISISAYIFIEKSHRKDRKIANQKVMIRNRDILIERQHKMLSNIKAQVNKHYYTAEMLENKINELFSNAN